MKKIACCIYLLLLLTATLKLNAQPAEQLIKIIVAPDHTDWLYKPSEKVKFSVAVLQSGNPMPNAKIRYEVGPEKMKPVVVDSAVLTDGRKIIEEIGRAHV